MILLLPLLHWMILQVVYVLVLIFQTDYEYFSTTVNNCQIMYRHSIFLKWWCRCKTGDSDSFCRMPFFCHKTWEGKCKCDRIKERKCPWCINEMWILPGIWSCLGWLQAALLNTKFCWWVAQLMLTSFLRICTTFEIEITTCISINFHPICHTCRFSLSN